LPLLIPFSIENKGKDTTGVIFWTDVGHLVERETRTECTIATEFASPERLAKYHVNTIYDTHLLTIENKLFSF
jgi:hypothetical protein